MPTARPKLSRVAQAGIRELRSEHGVEPTLDEIIWLHELGKAQEAAGRVDGILEAPAQAGKAFLWPMTIMAAQWYRNNALPWFRSSPLFVTYALGFALAHGRGDPIPDIAKRGWFERFLRSALDIQERRTLADLNDRREAADAIAKWVSDSGATQDEIVEAIDFVLDMPESEDVSGDKKKVDTEEDAYALPPGVNYDDIIHELAALSGTPPDYWRTQTSKNATLRAYTNVTAIERARRGITGAGARDALGEAIHQFRKAITAIIKAHKNPSQEGKK